MLRAGARGWRWLVSWICLVALAPQVSAQEQTGNAADARSPEQWLQMVQQAARRLDYAGTMIYQQGNEVRLSRIVHVFDGRVSHERLQPMDGRPREFIRSAEEVKCLIPESRRVVVERRSRSPSFPALGGATADVLQHYSVRIVGRERVGGFDCQVLEIQPQGGDRYGYRLWVDRGSGLLLRSQTLSERGEVLEQMAFADVRIGGVDREELKPSWSTDGWTVDQSAYQLIDMHEQGWQLAPPSGFKPMYSVRRPMRNGPALQAVYSDGLATLSVFIEQGSSAAKDEPLSKRGPINAYVRRVGDATVTVVGEIPPETARMVAAGVERVGR